MFLKENEASIIETIVYVSKMMIYKIALLSRIDTFFAKTAQGKNPAHILFDIFRLYFKKFFKGFSAFKDFFGKVIA